MSSADAQSEYDQRLEAARNADLSAVENKKIVQIIWGDDDYPCEDKYGNLLVMVCPALIDRSRAMWEESFQLFLRETHEVSFRSVLELP